MRNFISNSSNIMRNRYFVAYVGTKNEDPHMIINRFQDVLNGMDVNYLIIMTMDNDEVYLEEIDKGKFMDMNSQMN
jgi:hypothetical protein